MQGDGAKTRHNKNKALHGTIVRGFVDDLVAAGAVVFGGAPRDLARAQSETDAFYAAGGTLDGFHDPAVLPEHADRALVPADVDAVIAADDLERLDGAWPMVVVRSRTEVPESTYLNPTNPTRANAGNGVNGVNGVDAFRWPEGTEHRRLVMSYVRDDLFSREALLAGFHPEARGTFVDVVDRFAAFMAARATDLPRNFKLDLVVVRRRADARRAIGLRPDFDVNGMLMDASGLRLCESLVAGLPPMARHARLRDVLANVQAKRAVFLGEDDATNVRLRRLMARGWSASTGYLRTRESGGATATCAACRIAFGAGERRLVMPCCSTEYHAPCLRLLAERQINATALCAACVCVVSTRRMFFDVCAANADSAESAVRFAP